MHTRREPVRSKCEANTWLWHVHGALFLSPPRGLAGRHFPVHCPHSGAVPSGVENRADSADTVSHYVDDLERPWPLLLRTGSACDRHAGCSTPLRRELCLCDDLLPNQRRDGAVAFNYDSRWLGMWRAGDGSLGSLLRLTWHRGDDNRYSWTVVRFSRRSLPSSPRCKHGVAVRGRS